MVFPCLPLLFVSQKVSPRSQTEKQLERFLRAAGMWYSSRTETKRIHSSERTPSLISFQDRSYPGIKDIGMPLIAKGVKHKLVAQRGRYREPEKRQAHLEMLIPARGSVSIKTRMKIRRNSCHWVVPWWHCGPSYLRASHLQFSLPGTSFLSSQQPTFRFQFICHFI